LLNHLAAGQPSLSDLAASQPSISDLAASQPSVSDLAVHKINGSRYRHQFMHESKSSTDPDNTAFGVDVSKCVCVFNVPICICI